MLRITRPGFGFALPVIGAAAGSYAVLLFLSGLYDLLRGLSYALALMFWLAVVVDRGGEERSPSGRRRWWMERKRWLRDRLAISMAVGVALAVATAPVL